MLKLHAKFLHARVNDMMKRKRVALVTGGSRGIGKGIALSLGRLGIVVGLTYAERKNDADKVVAQIMSEGGTALAIQMQAEDRESVCQTYRTLRDAFGTVNILVNNAAIAQEKPYDTITDDDWDNMMAVNLRGPFICSQEALPDMLAQQWGRIINISSIGGQWGGVNQVHYAVSKAGLIGLTRSLAKLYSGRDVTTNAIAPGLVDTEMSADELQTEAGREKVRGIPAGRIANLSEITSVVSFLIGDDAGYITGQTLNVNGGMYFG